MTNIFDFPPKKEDQPAPPAPDNLLHFPESEQEVKADPRKPLIGNCWLSLKGAFRVFRTVLAKLMQALLVSLLHAVVANKMVVRLAGFMAIVLFWLKVAIALPDGAPNYYLLAFGFLMLILSHSANSILDAVAQKHLIYRLLRLKPNKI